MPRALRIEQNGFYDVINRGVARGIVCREKGDFEKFLEIAQDASGKYGFEIYSFYSMKVSLRPGLFVTR